MPHDSKGNVIKVGDKVSITFEVLEVFTNDVGCNVNLRAVAVGSDQPNLYLPMVTCNTKVLTKKE